MGESKGVNVRIVLVLHEVSSGKFHAGTKTDVHRLGSTKSAPTPSKMGR